MVLSDQLDLEDQDSNGSNPFNDDLLLPGNAQTLEPSNVAEEHYHSLTNGAVAQQVMTLNLT
jgi:hypothetical protein